jgi:hypothetical protein
MAIVLDHKANLREVRVIFAHSYEQNASVMARGTPHPISERGIDGSVRSRVDAELTLPEVSALESINSSVSATRRRGVDLDTS